MQNIIIDQPYRFVPPRRGRFWHTVFQLWLPRYLSRSHGIERVECRGTGHLRRSLDAGVSAKISPACDRALGRLPGRKPDGTSGA